MPVDPETLKRFRNLPIPKFTRITKGSHWIRIYEKTMPTNDRDILRPCLVYYLSEEMQADNGLLEALANRGYDGARTYLANRN